MNLIKYKTFVRAVTIITTTSDEAKFKNHDS